MVILFLAVVMLGISSWDTQIVDTRVFCFKSPISLKLLQVLMGISLQMLGHKAKKKKKSLNFMVKATLISREIRQMVAAGASP